MSVSDSRKRIYLCQPHLSGMEQVFVNEAFDSNWLAPIGPNVDAFEVELKEYLDSSAQNDMAVVALCSGTAALHLALVACGVGYGDEVICQSFTFCATANPIKYLGATPVFIDSEKDTWNMDPDLLEEAIIDRIAKTGKTPKAIIPVAIYGMPFAIDQILRIADHYGIPVVEDAAEALGSKYNGKPVGTFGRYGVLSFNGNKMITTSGGGALVCSSSAEKARIIWYASQAKEACPHYQHEVVGYNYRLSNVCAGIGRGQIFVLEKHLAHHRHLKDLYKELLSDVPGISVHDNPRMPDRSGHDEQYDSNFWLNTITLDSSIKIKGHGDNVDSLRVFLDKAGIEARPLMKPMHLQPVFKDAPAYLNGVSESLFKSGLCLPSGPLVSDNDVRYIVEVIKEAIL